MTTSAAAAQAQLGLTMSKLGDAGLLHARDALKTGATDSQAQGTLKLKARAKVASRDFEAMFLNSMFQQMTSGVDGDGPFGGSGALGVWRSFLTDQYAKSFAKTGGVGIASHVYDTLLRQQGVKS